MANQHDIDRFTLFILQHADNASRDFESSRKYLDEQGQDADAFASRLLKMVKRKQLENKALATGAQFEKQKSFLDTIKNQVGELMSRPDFSLLDFMTQENFSLQNRNLAELNEEEVKNILEDYLFLKMSSKGDASDESK